MNTERPTGTKVLFVDDHADTCVMAALWLSQHGFDTRTAGNAVDAMIEFDRFHPAMVIIDVALPVVDGFELLAQMRARRLDLPCVLCSGYGDDGTAERARREANVFLLKPCDPQIIVETVHRLVAEMQPSVGLGHGNA